MALEDVLTRVYDIFGELTLTDGGGNPIAIKRSRTEPPSLSIDRLPHLYARVGDARFTTDYGGGEQFYVTESTTINIICHIEPFKSNAERGEAQRLAERMIDVVKVGFWSRPRLELNASNNAPFDCLVEDIDLSGRTGIEDDGNGIAFVVFTLQVAFTDLITEI